MARGFDSQLAGAGYTSNFGSERLMISLLGPPVYLYLSKAEKVQNKNCRV
jgi:hypothetical protein